MSARQERIPPFALLIPFGFVALNTGLSFFYSIYPSILEQYKEYPLLVPLTLSLFLLARSVGGIFYGILSDAYGRRITIFIGMWLFIGGSAFAILDIGIGGLVFARFLQGLGSSVAVIVGIAIINDLYDESMAARITSRAGNIFALASVLLPILASYMAAKVKWQYNFVVMGAFSLSALWIYSKFIPESLPLAKRIDFSLREFVISTKILAKDRLFLVCVCLLCCADISIEGFYVVAPVVLTKTLGVPIEYFGYYVFVGGVFFALGSFVNRLLLRRVSIQKIIFYGFCIFFIGAFLMLGVIQIQPNNAIVQRISMLPSAFGLGFVMTNLYTLALNNFNQGERRGTATAVMESVSSFMCAITVFAVNIKEPSSFLIVAYLYAGAGFFSIILLYIFRKTVFDR